MFKIKQNRRYLLCVFNYCVFISFNNHRHCYSHHHRDRESYSTNVKGPVPAGSVSSNYRELTSGTARFISESCGVSALLAALLCLRIAVYANVKTTQRSQKK